MERKSRGSSFEGNHSLSDSYQLDLVFLSALEQTLSEWNSENDEQAYRDL